MIFLGEVISIKKNYVQWIDVSIGQTQIIAVIVKIPLLASKPNFRDAISKVRE